uniref:Outer membrane protein beta-barrel domain-containing protein n=1 Tax=Solibacter usitatus (strain Ellin6076) TaxID=234267 RepID=Q01ZK8_SOLUE
MAHKLLLTGIFAACAAMAQNWEVGGGAGYGVYRNATIGGTVGSADAGIRNAYSVTGVVGEDLFEHFSGEVRYIYHAGSTFLQSGPAQGSVTGGSHTFTYDALLHLEPRKSRLRLFAAFGAGAKYYTTSGSTPKPQPVPAIAGLTTQSQWEPAFDFGGGVKYRVTDHLVVRGDLRDYISFFPDRLIAPVGNAKQTGVLQQFTPMFGVGYTF